MQSKQSWVKWLNTSVAEIVPVLTTLKERMFQGYCSLRRSLSCMGESFLYRIGRVCRTCRIGLTHTCPTCPTYPSYSTNKNSPRNTGQQTDAQPQIPQHTHCQQKHYQKTDSAQKIACDAVTPLPHGLLPICKKQ